MPNAVAFTLITPRAIAFEGDAELVIATGTEGEIGILPSHAPFLTALKPGVLRATVRDGGAATMRLELACGEGFLQALPDKITILTDAALAADEVDVSAARADLAAATEEQRSAGGDLALWKRAQSKIDFANARLKVVGVGS